MQQRLQTGDHRHYARISADKRRSAASSGRWVSLETHDPDGFYVAPMKSEREANRLVDLFMDMPQEAAYNLMSLRKRADMETGNEHWIR